MSALLKAAAELQKYCDRKKWSMCFIGGLAVQRWGEPRLTKDADITLLTGFGAEETYIDTLLIAYTPRIENAKRFALANRVLLLESGTGVPLDIAMGALPFEENSVHRASKFRYATGCTLRTCSAEDLIVHKAFAGRPQDWLDIDTILVRQGDVLNYSQIMSELRPLAELKEEEGMIDELRNRIRNSAGARAARRFK